jgi:hypothetical protein
MRLRGVLIIHFYLSLIHACYSPDYVLYQSDNSEVIVTRLDEKKTEVL